MLEREKKAQIPTISKFAPSALPRMGRKAIPSAAGGLPRTQGTQIMSNPVASSQVIPNQSMLRRGQGGAGI